MNRRVLLTFWYALSVFSLPASCWAGDEKKADTQDRTEGRTTSYLTLSSPQDMQRFGPTATSLVIGSLQSPLAEKDANSIILRLRAFRPDKESFIIANEAVAELSRATTQVTRLATGHYRFVFKAALQLPGEPGEYLLRVDCLDRRVENYPQNLMATQSLFVRVQAPFNVKAKHDKVKINTPLDGSQYGTGSNIAVAGSSTNTKVVAVRVRFLSDSTVYQATSLQVTNQNWMGMLGNPPGGWPVGTAVIRADGLDSSGAMVSGETDQIGIKIKE
jgi:hypothetical protein